MSARPEDIARLDALERRQSWAHRNSHSSYREKMLCPDCTLTPAVGLTQRAEVLIEADGGPTLTEAQVRALLKPLLDEPPRLVCECVGGPHGGHTCDGCAGRLR